MKKIYLDIKKDLKKGGTFVSKLISIFSVILSKIPKRLWKNYYEVDFFYL